MNVGKPLNFKSQSFQYWRIKDLYNRADRLATDFILCCKIIYWPCAFLICRYTTEAIDCVIKWDQNVQWNERIYMGLIKRSRILGVEILTLIFVNDNPLYTGSFIRRYVVPLNITYTRITRGCRCFTGVFRGRNASAFNSDDFISIFLIQLSIILPDSLWQRSWQNAMRRK